MYNNFEKILIVVIPFLILVLIWYYIRTLIVKIQNRVNASDAKTEILLEIKEELKQLNSKIDDLKGNIKKD